MTNRTTFIIAEVGPNHNGSIDRALSMIPKLARTGVDAIKFQLAAPEKVYSKDAIKANYQKKNDKSKSIYEMSKKFQLKREDHFRLFNLCKKFKVKYACSAFDLDSLIFLDKKIKIPFFKIPSGEINSLDMIDYIAKQNKKIYLSTGMATFAEIKRTSNRLIKYGNKKLVILHCVSSYPVKNKNINLNVLDELKKRFNFDVGYSDHSIGHQACLAAVAKGAVVIEKHVTLSRKLKGPDHKTSCTISSLSSLIKKIRELEIVLGSRIKTFSKNEIHISKVVRKSLVATKDLTKGHSINRRDVMFKRPGIGISPVDINKVLGKKLLINIKRDKVIFYKNIK